MYYITLWEIITIHVDWWKRELFYWPTNMLHKIRGDFHYAKGAFHYAKLTDQRSVGIPAQSGTTFSN